MDVLLHRNIGMLENQTTGLERIVLLLMILIVETGKWVNGMIANAKGNTPLFAKPRLPNHVLSCHVFVRPSVRPSFRPSVRLSVRNAFFFNEPIMGENGRK